MNQKAAIKKLESLLPRIAKGEPVEDVLLKHAQECNLPPEQLRKLAQVYNTASTLALQEGPATREKVPEVVDTDALLDRYQTWSPPRKKRAAAPVIEDGIAPAPGRHRFPVQRAQAETPPVVKTASVFQPSPGELVKRSTSLSHDIGVVEGERAEFESAHANLTSQLLRKLGSADTQACHEMVQDLQTLLPAQLFGIVKQACFPDSPNLSDTRRVVTDRHGVVKLATQAATARVCMDVSDGVLADLRHQLQDTMDEIHKRAAGGAGLQTPDTDTEEAEKDKKKSRGIQPPDDNQDTVYRANQMVRQLAQDLSPAGKLMEVGEAVGRSGQDILPSEDLLRNRIVDLLAPLDEARLQTDGERQIMQQVALQDLMLRDPVISTAPPDQVLSLYSTVRRVNPEVALDKSALAFVLREALQYGGVPASTTATMAKERSELAKARQAEAPARPGPRQS